jgi:hypothetical protein
MAAQYHLHTNTITHMADEGLVTGMTISDREAPAGPCEPCLEGKQTQEVIHKVMTTCSEHVLGRVHIDICSPLPTPSHRSYWYFVTFIDDSSHYASISPLWHKFKVRKLLKAFITWVELETGQKVKSLRLDGGGEYMANHVQQYLEEYGIKHKVTTADTPQHNGMVECLNRTLLDKSRAMLTEAQLPKSYWLEALNYATFLHNVSSSRSVTTTPTKVYTGMKPDVSRLRVFGCIAHAHIPEKSRDKLSTHSLPCTFLGFAHQHSAFRLIHRPLQRFIESCDIIFDEGGPTLCQECIILESNTNHNTNHNNSSPSISSTSSVLPFISIPSSSFPPLTSHPKRITHPPIPDDDLRYSVSSYGHCANIADAEAPEPKTYNEVMASLDAVKWLVACEDKMQTWKNLDVYEIVPQPKGQKVIRSKWVFHVKRGPNRSIQKYKAWIIAQGFTQVQGIDFDQTFAPITKFSSLHTVFALAAEQNLKVHQMDVKAAYLNAHLKEEIYMKAPPGSDIPDGHVLKLKKGIYGTKQGGCIWFIDFSSTLSDLGYMRIEADHAVFVCKTSRFPNIITTYMDNMGLISEILERINQDKEALR